MMIRCKLIMEKSKENNKEKRMVDQPSVVKFLAPCLLLFVVRCLLFIISSLFSFVAKGFRIQ